MTDFTAGQDSMYTNLAAEEGKLREAEARSVDRGSWMQTRKKPSLFKQILLWKTYLIIILTPLLLMPIPIAIPGPEARCAYCILIMAVYWVTEVVELAVTALLPLVLFPLFGVLGSKQVAPPYFKDTNVLFLGGLMVAVAVEQWNLHKRIALRVLLLVGSQPRRLMLGFMLTTAFLSMWISNTATTAMMVPIVEAVLAEIKSEQINSQIGRGDNEHSDEGEINADEPARHATFQLGAVGSAVPNGDKKEAKTVQLEEPQNEAETIEAAEDKDITFQYQKNQRMSATKLLREEQTIEEAENSQYKLFCKGMMLAIAYAANIGGTATLTGTAPNLVFSGQVHSLFPNSPGFSFASWFGYCFPQMVILLFVAWVWLQLLFLKFQCKWPCYRRSGSSRKRSKENETAQAIKLVLLDQYNSLGPMSFAEIAVLVHFILLALLWLFRDPKFMPGWAAMFEKDFVRDATVAMFIAFSLFVFPSERPSFFGPNGEVKKPPRGLLEWKTMTKKFPWNIVILLGSGFALAEACKVSGLSKWVGSKLATLDAIPSSVIVIIVCVMITSFTEVTSNTATATIFLPILASLGEQIHVHPWYLMLPAAISCSFAFMLPVATPPNAIVFSGGHLKVKDMAKAGVGMNILAVTILVICVHVYGVSMFNLNTFPDWATDGSVGHVSGSKNVTLVCKNVTSS